MKWILENIDTIISVTATVAALVAVLYGRREAVARLVVEVMLAIEQISKNEIVLLGPEKMEMAINALIGLLPAYVLAYIDLLAQIRGATTGEMIEELVQVWYDRAIATAVVC